MHRSEAIQLIAEYMLSQLTPGEEVEAIRAFFNDFIPDELRPKLDPALVAQHDRHDVPPTIIPTDPRYQPVLLPAGPAAPDEAPAARCDQHLPQRLHAR